MVIGADVKLNQKSEFIKDLNDINQSLKQHQSEIKLVSAEYVKDAKSLEAQQARLKKETELLGDRSAKYSLLKARLADLNTAQQKNEQALNNLNKSYSAEVEKLRSIEVNLGKNSKEYKEQSNVVKSLATNVEVSTRNHQQNQNEISRTTVQLNNAHAAYLQAAQKVEKYTECIQRNSSAYKTAQTQISSQTTQLNALKEQYISVALTQGRGSTAAQTLGAKISSVSTELSRHKESLAAAKNAANKFDHSLNETGQAAETSASGVNIAQAAVTGLAVAVTTQGVPALKNFVRSSLNVGMEFEATMSNVEAISGATASEMQQLTAKAIELGATTKFTNREVGEAYTYTAMAGWKTKETLAGIDGIMRLAALSGSDLAKTSDIVTDALTALGYKASDSGRFVDVLAAASSNANTNVEMMGLTFQYVAPLAGSCRMSMEDLAFAIGLMANAGIKADKAGVALRNIITRLLNPTKQSEAWIQKLSLRMKDAQGNVVPLRDLLEQLRFKLGALSNAEQAEAASALAGKEALSGLLAIVNASPGDYAKLRDAIDDSSGAAQHMADVMMNNGKGAITLLTSKFESVQTAAYRKLKPAFETAIKFANDFVDALGWCVDHTKTVSSALISLAATVGTAKVIVPFLRQMKEAMTLKGEDDTRSIFTRLAQGLFKMNGVELVITGITAALGALWTAWEAHQEYLKSLTIPDEWIQKQAEAADAIQKSWEQLEETRKKSTDKAKTEELLSKQLLYELQSITDNNGKIKQGYEERAKFIAEKLEDSAGIEIRITNGVIQNYEKLTGQINTLVEAKRAKHILDAQEGKYNEALENRARVYEDIHKTEVQIAEQEANILKISRERTEIIERYDKLIAEARAKGATHTLGLETAKGLKLQSLDDALKKASTNLEGLQKTYDKHKNMAAEYAYTITTYQKNQEEFAAKHYNNLTELNWNYVQNAQKAGSAEAASLIGRINETKDHIQTMERLKEEQNTNMFDKEIENGKRLEKQLKDQLAKYIDTTKTGGDELKNVWDENAQKAVEAITGKTYSFTQAADGTVTAYVDGVKAKEGTVVEVTQWLVDSARESAKKKESDVKETGGQLTTALAEGMKEKANAVREAAIALGKGSILEFVKHKIEARKAGNFVGQGFVDGLTEFKQRMENVSFMLGQRSLLALKRGCDEHSPSRTARKYGAFLTTGFTLGIQDETRGALARAAELGTSTLESLKTNIDFSKLKGINTNIDSSGFRNSGEQYSSTPYAEQSASATQMKMFTDKMEMCFNNFLNEFKKMKLELNGNKVGEFMDRHIEKIFY